MQGSSIILGRTQMADAAPYGHTVTCSPIVTYSHRTVTVYSPAVILSLIAAETLASLQLATAAVHVLSVNMPVAMWQSYHFISMTSSA